MSLIEGAALRLAGTKPRKKLPTPSKPDLRTIHLAFVHSVAKLNSELFAILDAIRVPTSGPTFSPDTVAAIDSLLATVAGLRKSIAKVKPSSSARTNALAYLDGVTAIFTTLEQLGTTTDPTQAQALADQMSAAASTAQAAYQAARHALLLPTSSPLPPL